ERRHRPGRDATASKCAHGRVMNPRVLIVGAGPTGLNLALSLARRGVPFRIISEANGPGEHSRALAVQARTLEFYGQFGFADEVIAQGSWRDRYIFAKGAITARA